MDQLPSEPRQADKIVEGEVLDDRRPAEELGDSFGAFEEVPASFLRRGLMRVALALVIGLIGLGSIVLGVLLTVSVVGAFVGIPLVIMGLALILAAAWILFGGGQLRMISIGRGSGS